MSCIYVVGFSLLYLTWLNPSGFVNVSEPNKYNLITLTSPDFNKPLNQKIKYLHQQTLTTEKLETANVCHFCLRVFEFAWGRLKTPAHAEPCHGYIWWMSHVVCVHNFLICFPASTITYRALSPSVAFCWMSGVYPYRFLQTEFAEWLRLWCWRLSA